MHLTHPIFSGKVLSLSHPARGEIMTLLVHYPSKKALRENIGLRLRYEETSFHGPEYRPDGWLTVAGRPAYSNVVKREFFARVLMRAGVIEKVT
jgi:hypothetical protein